MFVDINVSKNSFPFFTAGSNMCFGAIGVESEAKNGAKGFGVVNFTV